MGEEKKPESFTVTDKRRFVADDSGAVKPETDEGQKSVESQPRKTEFPGEEKQAKAVEEKHVHLPEIDFSTFILSLSSSALLHLGLMENPQTKKVERNLDMAKQTIDIIGMLKEKTKGNLSHEEENLIENLLTDLRLRYVNGISKR